MRIPSTWRQRLPAKPTYSLRQLEGKEAGDQLTAISPTLPISGNDVLTFLGETLGRGEDAES
ncbi:MAG: hypothetical protein CMF04_15985 [Hyphomonas sp.]|nr:hypothetical protein [Hyphomonas sp.]